LLLAVYVQGGMCPTYCVAKALLNKAVQLMAADDAFKQRGVCVASVCPGWCRWESDSKGFGNFLSASAPAFCIDRRVAGQRIHLWQAGHG
jgi:NAD(P)-dependent dehydrogenase (short-subunit alcohol dehydrogenase family)